MVHGEIFLARCEGHDALQISLKVFHDDEDTEQVIVIFFWRDKNVNKPNGMNVFTDFCQLPQDLYLANDLDAVVFTFADILYEFDSNQLLGKLALGFDNLAVTSLPYDIEYVIIFHGGRPRIA